MLDSCEPSLQVKIITMFENQQNCLICSLIFTYNATFEVIYKHCDSRRKISNSSFSHKRICNLGILQSTATHVHSSSSLSLRFCAPINPLIALLCSFELSYCRVLH